MIAKGPENDLGEHQVMSGKTIDCKGLEAGLDRDAFPGLCVDRVRQTGPVGSIRPDRYDYLRRKTLNECEIANPLSEGAISPDKSAWIH